METAKLWRDSTIYGLSLISGNKARAVAAKSDDGDAFSSHFVSLGAGNVFYPYFEAPQYAEEKTPFSFAYVTDLTASKQVGGANFRR